MTILRNIKVKVLDSWESFIQSRKRNGEIRKFKDTRRVQIANLYPLSNEQKKQIDELYINNYGEKIDYVWHQNYAAHAGKFDCRFFPELLYIPEFEAYQIQNKAIAKMLSDKNFLPIVAKSVNIKMPETIVSCTNGVLRNSNNQIVSETEALCLLNIIKTELFVKPTKGSCSGVGCSKVKVLDKMDFRGGNLLINNQLSYGKDFVVQKVLKCHKSLVDIYPSSVNTFRVITYIWHNEIKTMPVILRIGQGGHFLDNAHAGGMFIAINNDGRLGKFAITEFNERFEKHPDTGLVFATHKIEHFDKVLLAAQKIHEAVPQIGVVNWDFTIDESGEPVLIEANCNGGSVWLIQMAHGVGAFGKDTEEVLQWMRFMKRLKPHERLNYYGGQMINSNEI